jgi:hypothetical protein
MKHKLLFKNYLKTFFLLAFFAVGNFTFGQATLPHYDGLNYTAPGNLQTQTGWTVLNSGDNLAITSGNLNYTGLSTSIGNKVTFDGAGIDTAKLFTQQTSGTVYYSFLMNVTSLGSLNTTTGGYFTSLNEGTGTNFGATVWTRSDGSGYNIGINPRTTAGNTVWSSGTTSINQTILVVISYQIISGLANDIVKLWINPNLGGTEPLATLTTVNSGTDLVNLNRILIRQDSATATPFIEMDELRIGTTWADVTPFDGVIWNGTAWSNGTGPDITTQAGISGVYSTATNGTFNAKNVVIQSGSLTVNSGTTLTIQDGIENQLTEAAFVIENNANLIQTNILATNTGNANVKSNSAPMVRLDYTAWSSPVTAQKAKAFSPQTLDARFYTYNPISNVYAVVTNPATTNLETGVGYLIRAADNSSPTVASAYNGQFIGVPVNGTKTTPVSIGFNLVGNPYASKLDAQTFLSNANTTALGITTLHFWSNTAVAVGGVYQTNNYASFNAMGGSASASNSEIPNGIIAVGQGFFVNPTSAGNVTFNNNMRTTAASTQFFKTNTTANVPTDKHRFWLNLSTPTTANNQILIGYTTDASNDFDAKYDAPLFGNTASVIYSKVADKKLVIQGRSSFATTDAIPLGIQTTEAGQFIIALADFDGLFLNQDIFLKDNVLNTIQNLKNGSYTFNAAQGEFSSRFEIVFDSSLLSTNSNVFNDASVIVIKNNNGISIETGNNTMANVAVYDIRGRLLVTKTNINANTAILNNVATSNQVLIVRITNTNNQTVTKKIVN